ncbi:MAG TPA: radical SAM protein [Candidatus Hydrogenedentes bacterium]|jgi:7-carboxy-7-deazaguanine synthase|nr:radical SAM protein [Candidatus Hydrogenedentota bacterium]
MIQDNTDPSVETLQVTELFASIQGESTWVGCPCGFVRLAGCNLRCAWCDTTYSYGPGATMTLPEIVEKLRGWGLPLVEITGGEPLLQPATPRLASLFLDAGLTVLVETNGSLPIDVLPEGVIRIMDIKCPDSGMHENMDRRNLEVLTPRDEVKFVLASRADYTWALDLARQQNLAQRCGAVLFSPAAGRLSPATLAGWMLEDCPPARLQLPLHKYIWPGRDRGV